MANILNFIDSADIRSYNENTAFSPMEQAVLIYLSRRTTVEEKLVAWKKLLDTYTEEEFLIEGRMKLPYADITNRQVVCDTVYAYEAALANRYEAVGAVFEAAFWETLYSNSKERWYFSDYDSALTYIQKAKQHYLDDEDLKDELVQAEITIKHLNMPEYYAEDVFQFDTDLRMINLHSSQQGNPNECVIMDDYFAYVPLPFKKGDIMKTICKGEVKYGVLPYEVDAECFRPSRESGDITDMMVSLSEYYGGNSWDYDHFDFMYLEKCAWTELPDEQKNLRLLSDVYTGKMEVFEFLSLMSNYQDGAYQIIHRYQEEQEET